MGKLDDIRRQREAQYARRTRDDRPVAVEVASGSEEPAAVEEVAEAPAAVPRRGRASSRGAAEAQGTCTGCRKVRPLQNGVIAAHQKGLGKVCVGSRKPPA